MAKIYIDGVMHIVNESDNLLQSCLSLGIDIPYFCWHPLLGSLGACRQCAVTQYNNLEDRQGRLIMSCMTPSIDGTIISVNNIESTIFRSTIIELLLTNHPHDCPVCEEGGHCHLQDMTVMVKHNIRNYRFRKRTHKNQYLGSFIKHEMNRCITCYRCVRYYNDYADGTDFGVYGSNNNIYFGRVEDGVLENEHSGNLIELCPTGVFTDKTHSKKYNRKWDMQYSPSICQNCSIGCNISIGERYGEIRRIENRYHEKINHYLICDLGRFGYSHNNLITRPKNPVYSNNRYSKILNFHEAINIGFNFFKKFKRVIGVGSIRASIENNFALQELVGRNNFSNGMSNKEQTCMQLILEFLKNNFIYTPSLREIESYDVILVLGEDLTQTSARVALAVRQAVKKKSQDINYSNGIPKWNVSPSVHMSESVKNSLFILHTHENKLDDISEWSYFAPIDKQVNFASAIAYELNKNLPEVLNIDPLLKEKALLISHRLISSKKTLIISGSHSYDVSIIQASINIAHSIKIHYPNHHVGTVFLTPSPNSLGVALFGGMSIESALEEIQNKKADAIIFMEYDLYRSISQHDCDIVFKNKENIITLDHQYTETYKKSGLTLPVKNFTESSGTVINFEGRAQRFFQVYDPYFYGDNYCFFESWKWLHWMKSKIDNTEISWTNLDDVISSYSKKYTILNKIKLEELSSSFRVHGQKISRSSIRSSGRTSLRSHIDVHEPRQPVDNDTMFAFSMEGYNQPHESVAHIPFAWFPGWNSPQAWNKFQKKIGKDLVSGNSGVRLFTENTIKTKIDLSIISMSQTFKEEEYWYIIPYYHLFGNEELTQYSSIIRENIPIEYALMSFEDGEKLNLKKDSIVEFNCLNKNYRLPIQLSKYLTKSHLGLPLGRKGFPISLIGRKIKFLQECIT
ncbi:NADH-quinone oxidoreductase subunit NuoG [Buchnera aphidicola (Macrosiphoniella sanborni)]|uniref:NADH-quinone oxidoreductase n=1 Tax=Buchnera aphidicola (Macrosiphoniella sanborni) TaxID=1241865 RepID=A0A4D6YCL4_9GAMM|nr:NADH-quinone oxidoreductase subunit NuoG [Buchnera aphidicola]QCI23714.1 NADH-quinone oxidoreductase subunit NuoG [Buchnera aphidicola (Macrosiphoniella sanborni)]